MSIRYSFVVIGLAALMLCLGACRPTYPKCDKDEHCRKGEFCVNGLCQQCRTDADCGEGQQCRSGRCESYCRTADDCPDGQACKDRRCQPCTEDRDCGPDGRCRDGRCLKPGQCQTSDDCPENHECQNGTCVAPPMDTAQAPGCTPEPVYFDYNEHVLTVEATRKLQEAARCIKSVSGHQLRIEGHCDPRGTEEYNLALGDRRAGAVKRYLERLGVTAGPLRTVSKGKLEATGTDASSWAMDRKAIFIWE